MVHLGQFSTDHQLPHVLHHHIYREVLMQTWFYFLLFLVCHSSYADELTHNYAPTGQYAVTTVVEKTRIQIPAKQVSTKTHSHRCSYDGTIWTHAETSYGNHVEHSCPRCGRVQWEVYSKPVLIQVQQQTNCPNGLCPNTQTIFRAARRR